VDTFRESFWTKRALGKLNPDSQALGSHSSGAQSGGFASTKSESVSSGKKKSPSVAKESLCLMFWGSGCEVQPDALTRIAEARSIGVNGYSSSFHPSTLVNRSSFLLR
jgi:hypothetical protein